MRRRSRSRRSKGVDDEATGQERSQRRRGGGRGGGRQQQRGNTVRVWGSIFRDNCGRIRHSSVRLICPLPRKQPGGGGGGNKAELDLVLHNVFEEQRECMSRLMRLPPGADIALCPSGSDTE